MQISAEIRWFWYEMPPSGFQKWFCSANYHSFPAGGGTLRKDHYLRDSNQSELGVKIRNNNPSVEIKGLVQTGFCELNMTPFVGPVDLWAKWITEALKLPSASTETVDKLRWVRKYIVVGNIIQELQMDDQEMLIGEQLRPEFGCNVELAQIHFKGVVWWTFGLEAFGKINTLNRSIKAAASELAGRKPPALPGGLRASYPSWFGHIYGDSK